MGGGREKGGRVPSSLGYYTTSFSLVKRVVTLFFIKFLKNFLSAVDPSQKPAHTGLTVKRKYVIIYVDEKRRVKKGK